MKEIEHKPVSQCQSLGEIFATLNHMVKEINSIEGVSASMSSPNPEANELIDKETK